MLDFPQARIILGDVLDDGDLTTLKEIFTFKGGTGGNHSAYGVILTVNSPRSRRILRSQYGLFFMGLTRSTRNSLDGVISGSLWSGNLMKKMKVFRLSDLFNRNVFLTHRG
jgi:hypothetical protein